MKNKEKIHREFETRMADWGAQPKNSRYDLSHERFIVPWQMERKEKKMKVE